MTNSTGKLVASGRCQGLAVWRIRVKRDQKIKLSFVYMDFYENMQWVQVRNGGSRHADLLAFSDGSIHLDDVTSSTNEMMVEFMTKSTSTSTTSLGIVLLEPTKSIHVHGFIAYYNVLSKDETLFSLNCCFFYRSSFKTYRCTGHCSQIFSTLQLISKLGGRSGNDLK